MLLLGGILLLVLGGIMLFRTDWFFALTEGWKQRAPAEPSPLYRASTRLGGVLCALAGIGGIIAFFCS